MVSDDAETNAFLKFFGFRRKSNLFCDFSYCKTDENIFEIFIAFFLLRDFDFRDLDNSFKIF